MNAARFTRNLIQDGVDPKLAQPLAEHLADEIERTVATKEHVELVVNAVVTRKCSSCGSRCTRNSSASMLRSRSGSTASSIR